MRRQIFAACPCRGGYIVSPLPLFPSTSFATRVRELKLPTSQKVHNKAPCARPWKGSETGKKQKEIEIGYAGTAELVLHSLKITEMPMATDLLCTAGDSSHLGDMSGILPQMTSRMFVAMIS